MRNMEVLMKINMKMIVVMRKNMDVSTYVMVIKHGLYLDSDSIIILSVCPKQSFLVAPTHLSSWNTTGGK